MKKRLLVTTISLLICCSFFLVSAADSLIDKNVPTLQANKAILSKQTIENNLADRRDHRVEEKSIQNENEYAIRKEGKEFNFKVEEKINEGTMQRTMVYANNEGVKHQIRSEIGIYGETKDNITTLNALLSSGERKQIKVMPEKVSQIALERLRTKYPIIELREKENEGVRRAIYHVHADKPGKLFGIFGLTVPFEAEVDAETGEIISSSRPWWAKLVSGEENLEE